MATRFRVVRLGALVAVVLAAMLATAMPAAAEVNGKFVGTVPEGGGHGFEMKVGGEVHAVYASLLGIDLDDDGSADLATYCVEIDVDALGGADMVEKSWADFPGDGEVAQPAKVLWVLHNSYPNTSLAALKTAAEIDGDFTKRDAITGTQAAIWHFANGATLHRANDAVEQLYAYLTGEDNTGLEAQPPASLSITSPESTEVEAGTKVGPFVIDTNASTVAVELADGAPEGVAIVDEAGEPVTEFADGVEFWLSAPAGEAAGAATVRASAQASVEKGRLFVGASDKQRTQTLIVATSDKGKARAEAKATWTTKTVPTTTTVAPTTTTEIPSTTPVAPSTSEVVPPTTTVAPPPQGGNLPETGTTILPVLGIGLLLLGAGVGLVLLQRRRASG